jgi:molybdopterin molybdotransferase
MSGSHASHSAHSTSVDEHAAHIAQLLTPALAQRTESIPIEDALGRVTAVAVHSPVDLPLFRNSQMDGFAVIATDLASATRETPVSLPIVGEVAARPGLPAPLGRGTAVRIMTGAPIPEGADAVVRIEECVVGSAASDAATAAATSTAIETATETAIETVTFARAPLAGEFVRERGSDVRAGDQILPARQRLAPRHLAVLAAAGVATVDVDALIRVAVITTGAELIDPSESAQPGEIHDSNNLAVTSAVQEAGARVSFSARVTDNTSALLTVLRRATESSDLIITSGGISMGDHEVVRETLEPLGAVVGHIRMQPGGPQATAVFEGVPVISFPGNPVSTQISFAVFVAPLLRAAAGLGARPAVLRILNGALTSVPGKRQFLRGTVGDNGTVSVISGPGSHLVAGLAAADVLIDVPEDATSIADGSTIETWEL